MQMIYLDPRLVRLLVPVSIPPPSSSSPLANAALDRATGDGDMKLHGLAALLPPRPSTGRLFQLLLFCVGFHYLTYYLGLLNGKEAWKLIARQLVKEQWLVAGSMSCATIRFHTQTDQWTFDFEAEWRRRFRTAEVVQFEQHYLSTCQSRNKTISAVLSSDRPASSGHGLGSIINFAVTNLYIADHAQVQRRFGLYLNRWNYVSWTALFRDFGAPQCAAVHEIDDHQFDELQSRGQCFNITFHGRSITMFGAADAFVELNGVSWTNSWFYGKRGDHEDEFGLQNVFRRRNIVARALLQPSDQVLAAIRVLWQQLVELGNGSYSAVHIRRSDKVALDEALTFPLVLYVRALRRLCHTRNTTTTCSRVVFVWCDTESVCEEFRRLAAGCFRMVTFRELARTVNLLPWSASPPVEFSYQSHFNRLPQEARLQTAQELVISVFLSAMAESFVCTYSSNLCRLAAVLRSTNVFQPDLVSLDWEQWIMH